ncbi:MAG TPA: group 1 truncated hemoglobin [Thermoanaerobaculia bacterium]
MIRMKTLAAAFVLLAWMSVPAVAHENSLYKRIGGYDAIAAVVDDFLGRLAADPQLAKFFAGHSTESLQRIRQLVVEQLCEATGGPCYYTGRGMKESHQGMKISQANWDAAVKHLEATFDKFKVPARERQELLSAVGGLRADIVEP